MGYQFVLVQKWRDGDLLVGKVTPKGVTELSCWRKRLLHANFWRKSLVKYGILLYVYHTGGEEQFRCEIFTRESWRWISPGVNALHEYSIVQKRKINEGDKMAGRHGNKGCPLNMPERRICHLCWWTPVDIMLNQLGSSLKRMKYWTSIRVGI